jgi:hypothetical protein
VRDIYHPMLMMVLILLAAYVVVPFAFSWMTLGWVVIRDRFAQKWRSDDWEPEAVPWQPQRASD